MYVLLKSIEDEFEAVDVNKCVQQPPPASDQVIPPVLPDCADKKYPLVGELETFKFASSTTFPAIVKAPLPVTSPV